MITNKETKWRKRIQYAKIIGKFNNCFSESIIYKRVFPIAINFCFDDISQVRSCSAKHNSKIILQLLSGNDEYKEKTLIIIKSFAQSINYKYRQLFIYMCTHLFENKKIFEENISELLIDLAYDRVPNVKIVLAKFINKILTKEKYKHLKDNDTVKKIVKILKNDKNKEVLNYIENIQCLEGIDDVDIEMEKNVNGKFKDNMNFLSKEFGITKNVPLNSVFKESKFQNDINKQTTNEDKKEENINNEIKEEETQKKDIKEDNIGEESKKEENKEGENKEEEGHKEEEECKEGKHKEEEKKEEENKENQIKEEEIKEEKNKEENK